MYKFIIVYIIYPGRLARSYGTYGVPRHPLEVHTATSDILPEDYEVKWDPAPWGPDAKNNKYKQ